MTVKNFFPKWIGQTEAIRYLNETLTLIERGEPMPLAPLFAEGHAGVGKTRLGNEIAKALQPMGFGYVEVPSSISLPQFIQLWGNLIEGQQVFIFWDECAETVRNKKVANLIKRLTETQGSVKEIATDSGHLTSNPFQHFWFAASNEEPKDSALFGPTGRFRTLFLHPYTPAEKKAILAQSLEMYDLKADKEALEHLEGRLKSNGRMLFNFTKDDLAKSAKLAGKRVIDAEFAKTVTDKAGLFPGGLDRQDIKTLNLLASTGGRGMQVSEIASGTGGEANETVSIRLRYLAGEGLIETKAGKKYLTERAVAYMHALAELQKAAKAAKKSGNGADKAKAKETTAKPAKAKASASKGAKEAKA